MEDTGESVGRLNAVKNNRIRSIPQKKSEYEFIEDEVLAFFPNSKYFQVHFQHCHENADAIQQELYALKEYVVTIEEKLERLMKLLDKQTKNV